MACSRCNSRLGGKALRKRWPSPQRPVPARCRPSRTGGASRSSSASCCARTAHWPRRRPCSCRQKNSGGSFTRARPNDRSEMNTCSVNSSNGHMTKLRFDVLLSQRADDLQRPFTLSTPLGQCRGRKEAAMKRSTKRGIQQRQPHHLRRHQHSVQRPQQHKQRPAFHAPPRRQSARSPTDAATPAARTGAKEATSTRTTASLAGVNYLWRSIMPMSPLNPRTVSESGVLLVTVA